MSVEEEEDEGDEEDDNWIADSSGASPEELSSNVILHFKSSADLISHHADCQLELQCSVDPLPASVPLVPITVKSTCNTRVCTYTFSKAYRVVTPNSVSYINPAGKNPSPPLILIKSLGREVHRNYYYFLIIRALEPITCA